VLCSWIQLQIFLLFKKSDFKKKFSLPKQRNGHKNSTVHLWYLVIASSCRCRKYLSLNLACGWWISHKKSVYFPHTKVHNSKTLRDIKEKISGSKKLMILSYKMHRDLLTFSKKKVSYVPENTAPISGGIQSYTTLTLLVNFKKNCVAIKCVLPIFTLSWEFWQCITASFHT
jgi:hypothetical protein